MSNIQSLQGALREAHEDASQKAMAEFNSTAVGAGSIRMKYEKRLQNFIKKAFEVKLFLHLLLQILRIKCIWLI